MDLTDFPTEIFDVIISFLDSTHIVRCQRVSKQWHDAFCKPSLNHDLLLTRFPQAYELRGLDMKEESNPAWTIFFQQIAARYHLLERSKPCFVEKLPLAQSRMKPEWCKHHPMGTWQRTIRFENKEAKFHHEDTVWTYDDGLLIFPSKAAQKYQIYDLAASRYSDIDLLESGSIVRRMRLCEKVLIVEWCEPNPTYRLKDDDTDRYRHFATGWDILLTEEGLWSASFRCEWKLHSHGLPLDSRDRFFSVHNNTHYALYRWQDCHIMYGEAQPQEFLGVWDIATHHPYRPSQDSGSRRPLLLSSGAIPCLNLSNRALQFYGVKQGWKPRFRELELDEGHVYVVEEEHCWLQGVEARADRPRLHKLRSTGIPFENTRDEIYQGPVKFDQCGADRDIDLAFCQREALGRREKGVTPCWRHVNAPHITLSDVNDVNEGVHFIAQVLLDLQTIHIYFNPNNNSTQYSLGPLATLPRHGHGELRQDYVKELLGKGKICGDSRWIIGENAQQEVVVLYFDWKLKEKLVTLERAKKVREIEGRRGSSTADGRPRSMGWRRHGSVTESGLPAFLQRGDGGS